MEIYKLNDFEKGSKKLTRRQFVGNGVSLNNNGAGFWGDDAQRDSDDFSDLGGLDGLAEGSDDLAKGVERNGIQKGSVFDRQNKVTDIRQSNKNPNRVNVYINDRFGFSLDIAQVVELKLKIGRVLDKNELEECRRASEYGKAYQRALEWALLRPRSVRELKDYLVRRAWRTEAEKRKQEWKQEREIANLVAAGEEVNAEKMKKQLVGKRERTDAARKYDFSDLIVERLVEKGYVNDEKFAEYYVENRFVKKGISKKRLKMELAKKGIAEDIINSVVGVRDDEEEIKKIIAKKYHKYDENKLIQYLCRQGFDYQLVQNLVRNYEKD